MNGLLMITAVNSRVLCTARSPHWLIRKPIIHVKPIQFHNIVVCREGGMWGSTPMISRFNFCLFFNLPAPFFQLRCFCQQSPVLSHVYINVHSSLFFRKGKLGEYAKKRLAANAHIFRHIGFLSLRNAQTIEPTTAWTVLGTKKLPQFECLPPMPSYISLSVCGNVTYASTVGLIMTL